MLDDHEHKRPTHDFDGITENRVNKPPFYFNLLFYGLIVWGVIFCAYYLFGDWSSQKEFEGKMAAYERLGESSPQPSQPAAPTEGEDEDKGETGSAMAQQLFDKNCASCHGTGGEGGIGPSLKDETYRYGKTIDAITDSISTGRPGGMPAFGNQFSQKEIESLAAFVRDEL